MNKPSEKKNRLSTLLKRTWHVRFSCGQRTVGVSRETHKAHNRKSTMCEQKFKIGLPTRMVVRVIARGKRGTGTSELGFRTSFCRRSRKQSVVYFAPSHVLGVVVGAFPQRPRVFYGILQRAFSRDNNVIDSCTIRISVRLRHTLKRAKSVYGVTTCMRVTEKVKGFF